MPPKSTELRLYHFDPYAYTATPNTNLYKYVDALCGTTGASALVNEVFLARMAGALQTIYFNDLDYIFGKIQFLARSPAESYPYNPMSDQLTSDQWDEVRVKDAWYRARISDFFTACGLGGTPDGIRMCVQAALAVDADIYEVWRYIDNFGITADLGRSPTSARNEVVIRPHKDSLAPEEMRLVRDMLAKIMPVDAIVTVNSNGLAVASPVPVAAAAASSTYFEVQKMVTATPILAQLPPPELLPIDLLPSEQWLFTAQVTPALAPYAAFNITAEYGYYYLVGGGKRSPIDSVTYGTMVHGGVDGMNTYQTEPNFQVFDTTGQYTGVTPWDKGDSPDNFPGGKFGMHPTQPPPLNPDGSTYIFPYKDQEDYITKESLRIIALGGIADVNGYRLPLQPTSSTARVFYPDYAISYFPPAKDSTVSVSLTRRKDSGKVKVETRNPINFVRPS
jgi:hypothetical protein